MKVFHAAFLSVLSCDQSAATSSGGRAEQVTTTASATPVATVTPSAVHAATPSAPRVLCSPVAGRTLSKTGPVKVDASGQKTDGKIDLKAAKYTWVDFFASWCGPCKEEQPRIENFVTRLLKEGIDINLVHVSLDDDLRQLTAYFSQSPLKSSLWLADGPVRETFLATLKMKASAALPEHAIATDTGSVKCFIEGALVDSDYAELSSTLHK